MKGTFHIHPDTLYTLESLESALSELGLSAQWLAKEVRPPKVARNVMLGSDILDALREHSQRRTAEKMDRRRPAVRRRRATHVEAEQLPIPGR